MHLNLCVHGADVDVRVPVSFVSGSVPRLTLSTVAKAHNVHQSYSVGARVDTYLPCARCNMRSVCQLVTRHQVKLHVHLVLSLSTVLPLCTLLHGDAVGYGHLAVGDTVQGRQHPFRGFEGYLGGDGD